jgi:hypothetical protein
MQTASGTSLGIDINDAILRSAVQLTATRALRYIEETRQSRSSAPTLVRDDHVGRIEVRVSELEQLATTIGLTIDLIPEWARRDVEAAAQAICATIVREAANRVLEDPPSAWR